MFHGLPRSNGGKPHSEQKMNPVSTCGGGDRIHASAWSAGRDYVIERATGYASLFGLIQMGEPPRASPQ